MYVWILKRLFFGFSMFFVLWRVKLVFFLNKNLFCNVFLKNMEKCTFCSGELFCLKFNLSGKRLADF